MSDERYIHCVEMHFGFAGDFACQVYFLDVLLSVEETECIHFFKIFFAQNRQVVESCPPLNTTNALSLFIVWYFYDYANIKKRHVDW